MRWRILSTTVATLLASLVSLGMAQEPLKPGPEHDVLKQMEGTWDTMLEGETKPSGKSVYKLGLGGFWLINEHEGSYDGMKFEGHGMETFDPTKQKYVSVWADSMSPSLLVFEGDYDKATKTFTLVGEGPGPAGPNTKYKSVTELKDKNTMLFKLYSNDDVMVTITYKRKQ